MKLVGGIVAALVLAGAVAAQPPAALHLDDARLSISTVVREDLFAGLMDRDMARFERGDASLTKLLVTRPDRKAETLAWRGGAELFRAALALEAGKSADYRRLHTTAMATLAEARAADPQDVAVFAITGGVLMLYADKLAPQDRAAAWELSYQSYQALSGAQAAFAEKLPPHLRGELMAGLVQSAQRTGRATEMNQHLDKMLILTKGTAYEAGALAWKADPKLAASGNLGCKDCHEAGRLAPSAARLAAKAG